MRRRNQSADERPLGLIVRSHPSAMASGGSVWRLALAQTWALARMPEDVYQDVRGSHRARRSSPAARST